MTKKKIQIRASEDELMRWKEAAYLRRVTLSEWMRRVLNRVAENTSKGEAND